MKLRKKFLLASGASLLLLVFLLGLFSERAQSALITENFETQTLKALSQSEHLLDLTLEKVLEHVNRLSTDIDLYNLFSQTDMAIVGYNSPTSVLKRLFYSYFSEIDCIFDIYLCSNRVEYSYHGRTRYAMRDFAPSGLFGSVTAGFPHGGWVPSMALGTHSESAIRPLSYLDQLRTTEVFRYVRMLNVSAVIDGNIITLDSKADTPCLVVDIEAGFFEPTLQNALLTPHSVYCVFTREGTIISASDQETGQSVAQGLLTLYPDGDGTDRLVTLRDSGREWRVASTRSGITGWYFAVATPVSDLRRMTQGTSLPQTALLALMTGLAMLFLWFIISRSMRPVENAAQKMKETTLAYGCVDIPDTVRDEARLISISVEGLNRRIESLMKENSHIARLEQEATLLALETQINPHFLYNALNRIHLLALRNGDEELANSILQLSTMLRSHIDSRMHVVFLHQELQKLEQYVSAMNVGREELFSVYYDIDPDLMESIVPKMFLQPFVENAILHGFKSRQRGGVIYISGWIEQNQAIYTVEDNGCGIPESVLAGIFNPSDHPSGFVNTNQRIRLLYGESYGVSVSSNEHATKVRIVLPLLLENEKD